MTEVKRNKPSRASFEAKVRLLVQYAEAKSLPEGTPVFSRLKDVQEWEDAALGLSPWVSYSVAAPSGPNADLRMRLDSILPTIISLQDSGKRKAGKPRRGKVISDVQIQSEHRQLAVQNNDLLQDRTKLESEVTRLKHLLAEKEREFAELLTKFSKVAPLHRP